VLAELAEGSTQADRWCVRLRKPLSLQVPGNGQYQALHAIENGHKSTSHPSMAALVVASPVPGPDSRRPWPGPFFASFREPLLFSSGTLDVSASVIEWRCLHLPCYWLPTRDGPHEFCCLDALISGQPFWFRNAICYVGRIQPCGPKILCALVSHVRSIKNPARGRTMVQGLIKYGSMSLSS
jgi:hypothetical protein